MGKLISVFVSVVVFIIITISVNAEPWVSQRYAQNCAGCHAPGRLNLPPKGRRCTLSCQGCHVSPQGGGLRNQYGIWNQQRWLRSFKNEKKLGHKQTPEIHTKQPYMKSRPRKNGTYAVKDFKTTKKLNVKEYNYGNKVYKDWHKPALNKNHFLSRVPIGDPYRLERNFQSTFGGDLRLMYLSGDVNGKAGESVFFPMSLDIGGRMRPTREKYSFVVEGRFSNGPSGTEWDELFESNAAVRSAYFMADDLMYNSFTMVGLFKPMFGNHSPDHYTLANQITKLGHKAVYKGISVGTAPNVPFGNITYIQPMSNDSFAQDEGLVLNIGGRFVTYSGSILLSYWSTRKPSSSPPNIDTTDLVALTVGGMYKNFIATFEFINYEFLELQKGSMSRNKGSVLTFEGKYKLPRENYLVANFAYANTGVLHTKGSSTQLQVGAKSFLYPGVETELLYITQNVEESGIKTDTSRIQAQLHLFF